MQRNQLARLYRFSFAMLAVAAAATTVSACTPTPQAINDPREILRLTAGHLVSARSVHAEGSVDGTVHASGLARGLAGDASLPLTGTRLTADVALASSSAAIHLEVPAILGLTADVRRIGPDAYLATSLLPKGWRHLSSPAAAPFGAGDPAAWLAAVGSWLQRPTVVPTRLADAACGSGTCYQLRLDVPASDLAAVAAAARGGAQAASILQAASVQLVLLVDRATLDLSDITAAVDLGATGKVTATLRFSRWNGDITIIAPPPNEIVADS